MKLFLCQCKLGDRVMFKHITAVDEESAFTRFQKEAINTGKYVGGLYVKEIKYVDNCVVEVQIRQE